MDYHFIRASNEIGDSRKNTKIGKLLVRFLPLFVLSLFLPFLVAYVVAPPEIGFFTRADTASELSIWISPPNAIVRPNTPVDLEVLASYEGEDLVPELTLQIISDNKSTLLPSQINYAKPFSGKVSLGKITLTPSLEGDVSIEIPKDLVSVMHVSKPVTINTRGAKIFVRD